MLSSPTPEPTSLNVFLILMLLAFAYASIFASWMSNPFPSICLSVETRT